MVVGGRESIQGRGGSHGTPPSPRVTVTVAEDHPLYRYALEATIRADPGLALVGSAGDVRAAVRQILLARPEVALVDLALPGGDGVEVIDAIVAESSCPSRALVVSAHTGPEHVERAMRAGAAGYLTKEVGRRELRDAILTVAGGGAVFSPEVHCALAAALRRKGGSGSRLTEQERTVLTLAASGVTTADRIAKRLYVSESTVKTHLRSAYAKLGVEDRAAAVAQAIVRGYIEIS